MAPVNIEIHVSPSGLDRVMNCTGQPFLAAGIPPEPSSPYAEMGSIAHVGVLGAVKAGDPEEVMNLVDGYSGIDFKLAQKWIGHATYLLGLAYNRVKGSEIMVEVKLPALQDLGMVPTGREGEHQADVVWVTSNRWNVLDYKSGSTPVEVKNNRQLLSYAWAKMKEEGLLNSNEIVTLWIYQPELHSDAQSWDVPMEALREFGKLAALAIMEAEEGGQLAEGPWCKYCPVAKAKACPLVNKTGETRREGKDLAKAGAAELSLALEDVKDMEQKVGEMLSLPKEAADISIPAEVMEQVQALVNLEAEMLAVGKGNADQASALLKRLGVGADEVDKVRALAKKPYLEAGKAVDAAFATLIAPLTAAKNSMKVKLQSWMDQQERARQAEIRKQKEEQDRIAGELFRKEQEAAKLKGEAKKAADAAAQKLRDEQARASVVAPPPPVAKPAGVASKKTFSFEIPEVGKIPERYLIKHDDRLVFSDTKSHVLVELDGALLAKDAAAGRLEKATWLIVTEGSAVRAS